MGKQWKQWQTLFSWAPKSLWMVTADMKLKDTWKKSNDKLGQSIKKQRYHFAYKGPCSQSYDFSSSHVQVWELDHKKGWAPKNWCPQTVVLEKTLESPLDSKEIQPVNPKGNQHWIFIGNTNAEAKSPILWSPNVKSQLIGKDPVAGKDWGQEEKRVAKDKMVGWSHQLSGHESERWWSPACCGPWCHRESDMTWLLNRSNKVILNNKYLSKI